MIGKADRRVERDKVAGIAGQGRIECTNGARIQCEEIVACTISGVGRQVGEGPGHLVEKGRPAVKLQSQIVNVDNVVVAILWLYPIEGDSYLASTGDSQRTQRRGCLLGKTDREDSEPPTTPSPDAQAPLPAIRPGAMQPLSELLAGPCDWMVRAVVFALKPFPVRDTGPDKAMLSAHAAEVKSVSAKAAAIAFFILHLQDGFSPGDWPL